MVDVEGVGAVVAGSAHDESARSLHGVGHGVERRSAVVRSVLVAQTEVDDARLAHLVGIVEDILHGVADVGVGARVQVERHEHDVGVGRIAHVRPVLVGVATSSYGSHVRAMRVRVAVALRLLYQFGRVQLNAVAVLRRSRSAVERRSALLPHTLDAQRSVGWAAESGVHIVESGVDHAHNHALAGVSLRQVGAFVYLVGASLLARKVEHLRCARSNLDVLYTLLLSQTLQGVEREAYGSRTGVLGDRHHTQLLPRCARRVDCYVC